MSDAFNEWLARAEQEKRLAAVQASYGLDTGTPSNRGASSATQQLKFMNIIGDLDPRLVKPKAQQQQAATAAPKSTSRSPQRGGAGGQSLLTTALQEQKKSQAAPASSSSQTQTAQKK